MPRLPVCRPIAASPLRRFAASPLRRFAASPLRRFATAYNAALQAGKIVMACSGYRVSARAGHHAVTFELAHRAIGESASLLADYFDACRRKRNAIDYDSSSVATDTEADELCRKAEEFVAMVDTWVAVNFPDLSL